MRRLWVHHGASLVGTLDADENGRFSFRYAESWLDSRSPFPVSVSLPLDKEVHGEVGHRFFANLLPEADLRRLLCQRLGISADNDFELLAAIGGECAGALTILPEEDPRIATATEYRPLSRDELKELATHKALAQIDGRDGLRLSLAGAQDKLPVLVRGGELFLPLGSAPSTHILKFARRDFKHLPGNEVLVLLIARHLGLPVVNAVLHPLGREGACLVTRYDRVQEGDRIERLHQEDLCQALGLPPSRKYEKEGGPTFEQCFEVVRKQSVLPAVDNQNLLRWLAFNTVVFNADAHAKNLALLYSSRGARLAPFYDLLCTRAYPRLAKHLAMGIGGVFDPTNILRQSWEALAEGVGIKPRFAVDTVRDLAERFPAALTAASSEFREAYGERPALQLIRPLVRKQARRLLKLVAS